MRDCNFSRHIRNVRGLHPDWRVYRIEAISGDRVKFTGDIARPAGERNKSFRTMDEAKADVARMVDEITRWTTKPKEGAQ